MPVAGNVVFRHRALRISQPRPLRTSIAGVCAICGFFALLAATRVPARPGPSYQRPTPSTPLRPSGARDVPAQPVQQYGDPNKTSQGDGPPIIVTCIGVQSPSVIHVTAMIPRGPDDQLKTDPSPLACRYEWDFGDVAGRWNVLPGWNAAHVYDTPGNYTITLAVTEPSGKVTHRTMQLRVLPNDRHKIYVSADGDDRLDGGSPGRAVRSAYRAFQLARSDVEVFFRRGDEFDVPASISLNGQGIRVRNYTPAEIDPEHRTPQVGPVGDLGALPVLRKVQGPLKQSAIFMTGKGSRDILFDGLTFDSEWGLDSAVGTGRIQVQGVNAAGVNIAIRGCTFRNVGDGLNTELRPTGVLMQDCTFTNELRAYGYYGNGTDHVIVGNVMTRSHQEHHIRCSEPGVTRLLIAYNSLSRPNNLKGGIELRDANWFYVADNHIEGGTMRVGPQDLGMDQAKFPNWPNVKCTWGVIQDNRFDRIWVQVRLGSEHCIVRNNVVRLGDCDWAYVVPCEQKGWDQVRKVIDLTLENNTAILTGTKGNFIFVQGKPMGLTIRNNVMVAPHLRESGGKGNAIYATQGLEGITLIEGNVYPDTAAGKHRIGADEIGKDAWSQQPIVKNDRYQNVPVDLDDNPPYGLGAGARMGRDKRQRDKEKAEKTTKPAAAGN